MSYQVDCDCNAFGGRHHTDCEADAHARIYVPESSGQVEAVSREAADRFGGYTKVMARGGWTEDGELIEEDTHVFLIHATTEADAVDEHTSPASALHDFAHYVGGRLVEAGESVAMSEINGEVVTVTE